MPAHLDEPSAAAPVDPLCFHVRGWLWQGLEQPDLVAAEAWAGDTLVGETAAFYARPDVNAALSLPADARAGFELVAHHATFIGNSFEFVAPPSGGIRQNLPPGGGTTNPQTCVSSRHGQGSLLRLGPLPSATGFPARDSFDLVLRARRRDGTRTHPLAQVHVAAIARDYRTNHFGILLDRRTTAIQRHANIFAEGPSLAEGSGEVALLLRRYLGPPPRRIVDVGCGLGSYGRGLLADGYDWMGAEVDAADCAELARLGLPHRQVDGRTLPFADAAFDAALCLEVLEHLDDPVSFLREVHRVAPRQLLVSVPNCELLGYLWDHRATPWHMLEADHRNFFTRWSLGARLREFYPRVELRFHTPFPLRTVEGTPLHYHLFAAASA